MSKQRQRRRTRRQLQWLAASMMPLAVPAAALAQSAEATLPEVEVLGTAEQAWKQAPGVSVVTRDDLATQPTNDLSEVLRKQPGVNLTGNSTSGPYQAASASHSAMPSSRLAMAPQPLQR